MKPLLAVLKHEKPSRTPIWLMRQAGRYLPEYRELRAEKGGFLAMAMDPETACEITMQPIRRYAMDGAIIFSDILTVPMALGQTLWFETGEGPKLGPMENLSFDAFDEKMEPVYHALRLTSTQLVKEGFNQTTLLGFAGAPWTVATYMIEGGGSKDHINAKAFAFEQPAAFSALMDMLIDATSRYLIAQINAGAEAVKLFDSWASSVPQAQFYDWVIDPAKRIFEAVRKAHPDVPVIGFPRGAGFQYEAYIRATGVNGCAIDSGVPLDYARDVLQPLCCIQGNLEPAVLRAGGEILEQTVGQILNRLDKEPFIFNLGHGINKETPPKHVDQLLRIVRKC